MGGAVIGLGLLAYVLIDWAPRSVHALQKQPAQYLSSLLPILAGYCFGALLVMCAGGLVGWAVDATFWGTNWAGDAGLVWGVGGEAGDSLGTRGPGQLLTNGGHAMVLVLVFVFAASCRKSDDLRSRLIPSAWAGLLMGTAPGVLGALAVPLATSANVSMAWLTTATLQ
jgi:hypothetical protein